MADTTEIAPNNHIPAFPPLPGVAPLVHAPHVGDGQIWLLGSAGTAVAQALTPQPPQRILLLPAGSTISSITNPTATTASSSGAANNADDTPQKGHVTKCKFPRPSARTTHFSWVSHGDAPPLPNEFKEKLPGLLPTAMHVVWLALQLPNMWSRIYMDNLFNS